jgi:uncharacterized membrane protein
MSAAVFELLDLIARWVHVIAGIMWIGNSLLFNWLDRSLVPARDPSRPNAPLGTIWLLHSGWILLRRENDAARPAAPVPLHWFKWQAIRRADRAALLAVVLRGDRAVLADPSVALLSHRATPSPSGSARRLRMTLNRCSGSSRRVPPIAAALWISGSSRSRSH